MKSVSPLNTVFRVTVRFYSSHYKSLICAAGYWFQRQTSWRGVPVLLHHLDLFHIGSDGGHGLLYTRGAGTIQTRSRLYHSSSFMSAAREKSHSEVRRRVVTMMMVFAEREGESVSQRPLPSLSFYPLTLCRPLSPFSPRPLETQQCKKTFHPNSDSCRETSVTS